MPISQERVRSSELYSRAGAPASIKIVEGQDRLLGNGGRHTPILRKHSASPSCTVNMCVPVPWKRNRTLKSVN